MNQKMKEYFDKLSLEGIVLTDPQKWWYVKKYEMIGEEMFREYPSTPDEAFAASQDGYWYASLIKELYDTGHITNVSYDRALPVFTAWDLGQADPACIWFFQITRAEEINFIDFWQKPNVPLEQVVIMLKSKGYNYEEHIWPHDAKARDRAGITFESQARNMNLYGRVLEMHGFLDGIRLVKSTMPKMWFDRNKCKEGLIYLENYKKKWNSSFGGWTAEEVHDQCSHCAAAMRYACAGMDMLRRPSISNEEQSAILRKFFGN